MGLRFGVLNLDVGVTGLATTTATTPRLSMCLKPTCLRVRPIGFSALPWMQSRLSVCSASSKS